jgi:hypothetical protein
MSNDTKTLTVEQFNEISRIQSCLNAIADLLCPEPDLHIVGREELTCLFSFFLECLDKVKKGTSTRHSNTDAKDEIDEIQYCLKSITDLMTPCSDMSRVDRNDLAMLFGYLSESLKKAIEGGV